MIQQKTISVAEIADALEKYLGIKIVPGYSWTLMSEDQQWSAIIKMSDRVEVTVKS